jgi:NADPH:quinone reductase-like Zn-dependent oxidoreductase
MRQRLRYASCPLSRAFTGPFKPMTQSISRAVGGGVGHLAVQIAARALEAGMVISSGSTPQSIALARQSGADHVFDYKRDDIAAEIAKLTSDRGVALVFDATYSEVGFVETAKTVRRGGSWIVFGVGPGKTTRLVETHSPVEFWLSAAPSMSTSICCATSPNPRRSTARRRPFFSVGWLW